MTGVIEAIYYKIWSESDGSYMAISSILQCKIRHKSFKVVVLIGLLCLNLSKVEAEILWCFVSVYVVSLDFSKVFQNGSYFIMAQSPLKKA